MNEASLQGKLELNPTENTAHVEHVEIDADVKIYPNVFIGEGSIVEGPCVLGKPPRGTKPGELPLVIGKNAVIRPFTTLYAGSTIGDGFQTGQGVSIREDNIIGHNVSVGTNAVLEFGNRIGNYVRIHTGCFLEMVVIEDHVFVGPRVVFTDDPHPMGCPKYKECKGGAIVRAFARVGANSTILPGVVLGRSCLIGASAVVTKDVGDNTVVVGNPARPIGLVSELSCSTGAFCRPYVWPPYDLAEGELE